MHVVLLDAFQDLTQIGSYAWGVTTLVHMYDNLNDASKSSGKQLARYITLLQCQTRYSLVPGGGNNYGNTYIHHTLNFTLFKHAIEGKH